MKKKKISSDYECQGNVLDNDKCGQGTLVGVDEEVLFDR